MVRLKDDISGAQALQYYIINEGTPDTAGDLLWIMKIVLTLSLLSLDNSSLFSHVIV